MQTITLSHDTLADGAGHTFFGRDPTPHEEPPQRGNQELMAALGQSSAQLACCRIGGHLDKVFP